MVALTDALPLLDGLRRHETLYLGVGDTEVGKGAFLDDAAHEAGSGGDDFFVFFLG